MQLFQRSKGFSRSGSKQKGFTAIELSVVLVSIVALTGVMYQTVVAPMAEKRKITQASIEVQAIITAAMASGAAKYSYAAVTLDDLKTEGYMGDVGGSLEGNPWGGTYALASINGGGGMSITIDNMFGSSCTQMAETGGEGYTCTVDTGTNVGTLVMTF